MLRLKSIPAIALAGAVMFGASTSVYAQEHGRTEHHDWLESQKQINTECRQGAPGESRGECVRSAAQARGEWKEIQDSNQSAQDQGTVQNDQTQQTNQTTSTQDLYQSCMAQYNDATFCTTYVNSSQIY